jgi:hypothetical protein
VTLSDGPDGANRKFVNIDTVVHSPFEHRNESPVTINTIRVIAQARS